MTCRLVQAGIFIGFSWLALWPAGAFAQADTTAIAGSVRDTSGGVLPGVTIEASSPALIERSRTVVSDANGLYRIIDLRPGTYIVTFTLAGFNTARREGIELVAGFTAPLNMVMTVGALEETITVTGAAPVVDVSNVATRTPLPRQVLDGIPSGRNVTALGALIPGANPRGPGSGGAGGSDVGGSNGISKQYLRYHGLGDTVTLIDGMRSNAPSGGEGDNSQYYWGGTMVEELSYVTSDGSAEAAQGGLRLSVVPKEGGNNFNGTAFFNYTNSSLNADNFGDLGSRNLRRAGLGYIKKIWDFNPAIGGPIKRDRLWFFYSYRHWGVNKTVNNCFDARTGEQCEDPEWIQSKPGMTRLTWQMTQKNKIVSYFDKQSKTRTNYGITALIPTDASGRQYTGFNYVATLKFTSTLTNRFLLEAGTSNSHLVYYNTYKAGTPANLLSSQELTTSVWSVTWNNGDRRMDWDLWSHLTSLSYVTGSHSFKTGLSLTTGTNDTRTRFNGDVTLQTRGGTPVGVVLRNTPSDAVAKLDTDMGLFIQDQWTFGRATITGGLRYDAFIGRVPAQFSPAGTWVPERSYAEIRDVPNWKDISPRMGVAYDVFGNGKTGIKMYLGRYVIGGGNTQFPGQANPFTASGSASDTRSWTDQNNDGVPQLNELGPSGNSNFGLGVLSQRPDDAVREGWHVRPYVWQYNAAFSQEVLPRVAINVGFHRNSWRNDTRAVNVLRTLSDYTPFPIVSPYDGAVIQMYDVDPAKRPLVDNVVKFASEYGELKQTYTGFDVSLNSRLPNGALLQGGVSVGRVATRGVVTDDPNNCEGSFYGATRFCDITPPFRPEVKFMSSYPLPWQFVANAALQIVPGPEIRALYNVTSAIARPTLGRNLSVSSIPVDLIPRHTEFGDTLTQLDVRLARTFRLGRYRLQGQFDLYNLTNSNAVSTEFTTWGPRWREPQDVTVGRLAKFGVQLDF
jgi:hypothetical protein